MKRKDILARAITLGLLLAMPLSSAWAEELNNDTSVQDYKAVWDKGTSITGNNYNYTVSGYLEVVSSGTINGVNELSFGSTGDYTKSNGKTISQSQIASTVQANTINVIGKLSIGSSAVVTSDKLTVNGELYNNGNIKGSDITVTSAALRNNNGSIDITGKIEAENGLENHVNGSIETGDLSVKGNFLNQGNIIVTNQLTSEKLDNLETATLSAKNINITSGNLENRGNINITETGDITVLSGTFFNRTGAQIEGVNTINAKELNTSGSIKGKALQITKTLTVGGVNEYNEVANVNVQNIKAEALINRGNVTADYLSVEKNISNGGKLIVNNDLLIEGVLKNLENASVETKNITIRQAEGTINPDRPVEESISFNEGNIKVSGTMTLENGAGLNLKNGTATIVDIANMDALGENNISIAEGTTGIEIGNAHMNDSTIKLNGTSSNTLHIETLSGSSNFEFSSLTQEQVSIGKNESSDLKISVGSNVTDTFGNDIAGGMVKVKSVLDIAEGSEEATYVAASGATIGEVVLKTNAVGETIFLSEAPNQFNQGISEMASIALMAWRQENNDMNKRLGELRDSKGEHGVWARMTRGEAKYGAQNIKNQYNSYQLGYDEKLSVDKHWTVGAAFTYTDAESSFTSGRGENKHKGFAVYGSRLNDDGSFIDLIAKYSRLEHEFEVNGGAGKGDYDTNGYSLSAEYGKRFTKDNGLWLEPQVELTYGRVGSVSYLTNQGVNVRQNGMDSLVARLGFALGKDLAKGKGNVYLRASYLYDFDGETDVQFSKNGANRSFEQDLGGGWWEVGVGTNLNLSEAMHLYFDVEKTYGGDVATPWQWNAGVRWSF